MTRENCSSIADMSASSCSVYGSAGHTSQKNKNAAEIVMEKSLCVCLFTGG